MSALQQALLALHTSAQPFLFDPLELHRTLRRTPHNIKGISALWAYAKPADDRVDLTGWLLEHTSSSSAHTVLANQQHRAHALDAWKTLVAALRPHIPTLDQHGITLNCIQICDCPDSWSLEVPGTTTTLIQARTALELEAAVLARTHPTTKTA